LSDAVAPLYASQPADVTIENLNLSYGDSGDWYVLRTPSALKWFGSAQAAQLVKDAIGLRFLDRDAADPTTTVGQRLDGLFDYDHATLNPGRLLYLFAGQDTDSGPGLKIVPIQDFEGVPDYYLIRVVNPNNAALIGSTAVTNPQFQYGTSGFPEAVFTLTVTYVDAANVLQTRTETITIPGSVTARSVKQLADAIQAEIDKPASQIKNLVRAGTVGIQDQRLGFWLSSAGGITGKSISITYSPTVSGGLPNGAHYLYFASGQSIHVDHRSVRRLRAGLPSRAVGCDDGSVGRQRRLRASDHRRPGRSSRGHCRRRYQWRRL
jgi:hypothetical protein